MNPTQALAQAVSVLRTGGVIAYPTEAVYGLGCDPKQEKAVRRILELKKRDPDKGLILIAAGIDQLEPFIAPLSAEIRGRVLPTWPGPVTWLLPARNTVSSLIRGRHRKVAVRVTDHPLASELCRQWGGALVSTSANPAGTPPAQTADQVRAYFGNAVDFVLEGPLGGLRRPTQIRDAETGHIYRPG